MSNLLEGNKLIAEFMKLSVDVLHGDLCYADWDGMHSVKYHESWDWLMPVVEKIESIYDEHHGYFGVHISSNSCSIQGTKLHLAIDNLEGYGAVYMSDPNAILDTKIASTWYNVVQFITWYEKNKKR